MGCTPRNAAGKEIPSVMVTVLPLMAKLLPGPSSVQELLLIVPVLPVVSTVETVVP
jgi:hypothetical protein